MKAFILLSGGMDSTTLLALAVHTYKRGNIIAVNLDYGQRHQVEMEYAKKVASFYNVPYTTFSIRDSIGKGGLTDDTLNIPSKDYSELEGVSPTYVPFRNGLLLSTITSLAAGELGRTPSEEGIVGYGAHAEDAANWAYPDCTPEFIGAMANAIYIGSYSKIRLWTPLMWMSKAEVVSIGDTLQVPWHLTWSCYEGRELHCGVCPTCRARKGAFGLAGVSDPTEYAG